MKLGWLSRAGIVLTAFGLPIATAYFASEQLSADQKIRATQLQICLKFAAQNSGGHAGLATDKCYDEWEHAPTYAGTIWWESLLFVTALCAVTWTLALAIYWSVVWILRGRRRAAD